MGNSFVGTGHASRYPYSLDCRYDVVAFVFSTFSFSSGLPGGSFIPTLVTGGLLGQIVALILVQQGVIAYENISYIMLICMSAFLVAVIRTPLTAIVLITEITGHLEVFYPSIVVGGLTYYFTEMLQIKPFNVILYDDMINSLRLKKRPATLYR